MLEIALGVAVCIGMAKVADFEDRSPVFWFGITFVLCAAAVFLIPLSFLRMLLAGVVAFGLMMVGKFFER